MQIAAGQHYAVNAGQGIRQFAHGGGIHHIAHQGELVLQSQHADTRIESARHITLGAAQDARISARSITLVAEDGSFIRIGDGITLGTKGAIKQHAASFPHAGPQTIAAQHVIGFGGIPGVSDEAFAKGLSLGLRALKGVGLR